MQYEIKLSLFLSFDVFFVRNCPRYILNQSEPFISETRLFTHCLPLEYNSKTCHFLLQTLSHPEYYGLNGTRHFFVETSPGVQLGVWHILPRSHSYHNDQKPSFFANDNQPVVLYLHGSAESRSAAYRRSMYNVLSNEPIRAHIITFDYRWVLRLFLIDSAAILILKIVVIRL